METKKVKGEKKADHELRKFSVEVATYLVSGFHYCKG